jgi:general secretion pathway protein E
MDFERLNRKLIEKGILTRDQVETVSLEHRRTGTDVVKLILQMDLCSSQSLYEAVSEIYGIPYVFLSDIKIPPWLIESVPAKIVCHYNILPFAQEDRCICIALSDPENVELLDELKLFLNAPIKHFYCSESEIKEGIKKYYGVGAETIESLVDETNGAIRIAAISDVDHDLEDMSGDATIIKFVNQILLEAIRDRATDIHIEPMEQKLRIRYRIDGLLYEVAIPAAIKQFESAIVSRIKIMANLNIAEKRLPQDGRIKVRLGEEDLDLRISILPTSFGESVGIRILQQSAMFLALEQLGLDDQHLSLIQRLIARTHGIILVSGPTGSGKTTTLYACLSRINTVDRKIITIEDPIEYQIKGVSQMQVQPQIDFTFATALRSILRHDPDIIMVGEIRDFETAEIAIRTALTGHLVFSTIHTNDAASAITRLSDIGIEPYLIASSVECIIAQRLVRLICPECRRDYNPSPEILKTIQVNGMRLDNIQLQRGVGCKKCKSSGYYGRTGIYEILLLDDAIRELVMTGAPASIIKQTSRQQGMATLKDDGLRKVGAGLTTIEEVLRVTQEETVRR